jgi:hypothetical protein
MIEKDEMKVVVLFRIIQGRKTLPVLTRAIELTWPTQNGGSKSQQGLQKAISRRKHNGKDAIH